MVFHYIYSYGRKKGLYVTKIHHPRNTCITVQVQWMVIFGPAFSIKVYLNLNAPHLNMTPY
jgi:hypothetical protein